MKRKSKTLWASYPKLNTSYSSKIEKFIKINFLPKWYKAKDTIIIFLDEKLNFFYWKDKFGLWLIDVFFTTLLVSTSLFFLGFDKSFRLGLGLVLGFEFLLNTMEEIKSRLIKK